MKNILLIAATVFISMLSQAQSGDTIPNAGFENWYYTPVFTIEANGWQTNNSSIAAWNVIPDSTVHSGLLALLLQKVSYKGIIWSGFPISQHPVSFTGFMKNGLSIADTAFIRINVYSANVITDSGYAEIYGGIGTVYLPFSISISQNSSFADSCVITLEGGNTNMSSISFDDLSLTFPTGINEYGENSGWKIFPNPFSDEFCIASKQSVSESVQIILADVIGKKIREEQCITNGKFLTFDTQSLPAGAYLLSISAKEKSECHLVIKK